MLNALTIDVEDYFQVTAFEHNVERAHWDYYSSRVVNNTLRILDLLGEFDLRATFFVLGWVAERKPALVQEIQRRGHEIACHGYGHQLIYRIGPQRFREDVRRARSILEDICGLPIAGYRAPSYSITDQSLWALDILIEEGFSYDSSIFPVKHDIYGISHAGRFPSVIERPAGSIREFPLSTLPLRFAGNEHRLPIAGGGYLRFFPSWVVSRAIEKINGQELQPAVLYFHPWEIDPHQPRIKSSLRSRFRHYLNLDTTELKLRKLLAQFDFGTMAEVLDIHLHALAEVAHHDHNIVRAA
jgi:polysaccharide deacetylase family protein (PEP-CTERM system associated)